MKNMEWQPKTLQEAVEIATEIIAFYAPSRKQSCTRKTAVGKHVSFSNWSGDLEEPDQAATEQDQLEVFLNLVEKSRPIRDGKQFSWHYYKIGHKEMTATC